ncbi:hypothetical protein BN946_scf184940.g100 [Trametes cinnabarina]|uniref:Cytochrome P450 n=1 Tax=Pycnoporus cinnabarinus TaxID=5643 RepID=A0A060SHQ1_PYCCI|nr:hypothetical protein BN946_scf184940.g100 [Trametes cinnabarina]
MSLKYSIAYQDLLAVSLVAVAFGLWKLYRWWSFAFGSPLRNLPGPPSYSLLYGNVKEVFDAENYVLPDKWFAQYGKNFVDNGFFMTPRLWTLDARALNHILTHYDDYARPEENANVFKDLLGKGILLVGGKLLTKLVIIPSVIDYTTHRAHLGEEHRQQNPAFGPAQIRDLTEIFVQKSQELANIWSRATRDGPARVNVNADLSKMTLDVIGLAGFGYDFHALNAEGKSNELNLAFRSFLANNARGGSIIGYLRGRFPILKYIPNARARRVEASAKVIRRVGRELVQTRKAALLRELEEKHVDGLQRKDLQGRDLLTLLIKANMAKDVPDSQRLSDEDVIGQIPTFLIAGHETTSTSTTWALYALSKNTEAQKKLREELFTVETDTPTMDELSALPYLDMVVRETLRLHAPVAMLFREAKKDDVIPVSEPFIDRYGKVQQEIRVAKGNKVMLPILALHRSKAIWGEDALEFKPERWEQPPEAIANVPGVWGHLLAFIGGPRACIGYRFSLIETKAILFTLLRMFEFELAVAPEQVVVKTMPLQRPYLRNEEGSQLPLILKPVPSTIAFTAVVWKLWKYYWYFVVGSPLRNLPGPPVSSFIYGNEKELFKSDNHTLPEKWFSQYGKHFVDNGFLMAQRLWTLDPRALNHILTHYDDYGRLEENMNTFTDVLGKGTQILDAAYGDSRLRKRHIPSPSTGVLFVTGDAHRKQNPAFGPAQVRNLTGIFLQKASELARIWSSVTRDGPARVDANSDLSKMALDVIGLAGFGYDFHALNADGQPNELNLAFRSIMGNTACMTSFAFYLGGRFPILRLVPNKGVKHMLDAAKVIHRVARVLVETRKAAVLKEMEKSIDGLKRQDLEGQDLLTLLIKANMAEDVPDSQKLSDEDVMGQIPTFLFAGHETVSTAITWTFFALSRNTEAQKKLREELSAVETDRPTADELSALPYLDMVVRETLRLHSPVAMLFREAKKNDVIPLSEPFIDRYGRVRQEIEIAKGNKVALPILALHRSKAIWGEDAMEFRPERWQQPPEAIAKVPGVWGHLLAFIGGPRACIGYRFALLEIKAALFTLVRGFEFELAVPQERVVVKTGPLQRPVLCGEEGAQLPIIIKAI